MTKQAQPPVGTSGGRRRLSLFRMVLSIAVAALVAAWLPFSVLYVSAMTKHVVTVATAPSPATHTAGASSGQTFPSVTPVITHVS